MKRRRRNDKLDRLAAAAARWGGALVRTLPLWACGVLAAVLGELLALLDGRHRRLMIRQMRLAFRDEFSEAQRRRLARACYRHEAFMFLELLRLPKIDRQFVDAHIDTRDFDRGVALKASGRGVLVITAHIGCWEVLAQASILKGYPIMALARPLKNPYLNDELVRLRTSAGNEVLEKFNSLRAVRAHLDRGKWVAFLYDQNGGPNDAFIPFFGVPAATWRSASYLHWRCNIPILIATLSREDWKGSRYTLHVHRILEPREGEPQEESETRVLGEINTAFEEAIRAHPEQWIWQHRRWKTRPPGENSRLVEGVPEEIQNS